MGSLSSAAGTMLTNSYVGTNKCGATGTGWYNGNYLSIGGTAASIVCFN
jgi:hypothetical protein